MIQSIYKVPIIINHTYTGRLKRETLLLTSHHLFIIGRIILYFEGCIIDRAKQHLNWFVTFLCVAQTVVSKNRNVVPLSFA